MKKSLFAILVSCICCIFMLCMSAGADTPELLPDENARYTVTYSGTPNEYYFLIVLDGIYHEGDERTITEESILYLSQSRADKSGNVAFSGFRPKPCDSATVFISGHSIETPEICGYINSVSTSILTVPANSTVHFADGTTREFENQTTFFVPAEAGFMYVNSDYSSHALYIVDADGVYARIAGLDDAVVGINGASMRTEAPQGLRFYSYVSTIAKEMDISVDAYEISEYGFIVTAETSLTGLLGGDYTLDMSLVNQGKAVKGVSYQKDGKDFVFDSQDDYNRILISAVLLNIPENKNGYTTTLASRPYYILSDGITQTILYGEVTKRSVYEVALSIKNENGDNYYNNKDYIDGIIGISENK